MTDQQTVALHVVVRGRVQGVGYRAWCADTALRLGLSGWVRNRRSGEVEALFSGPRLTLDRMLEACRKGPQFAWVEGVDVREEAGGFTGEGFEVRATA